MTKNKIPKFKNIVDEAKFWDTHDVNDYLDEMNFVDVKFLVRQKKEDTVTIRMEPKLKSQLENLATSYGVNLSSLTRMWILERLRQVKHAP